MVLWQTENIVYHGNFHIRDSIQYASVYNSKKPGLSGKPNIDFKYISNVGHGEEKETG